jgi:hypothetical protein
MTPGSSVILPDSTWLRFKGFMNMSNKSFDSSDSLYAHGVYEHEHIIRTRSGLMFNSFDSFELLDVSRLADVFTFVDERSHMLNLCLLNQSVL